jgi:hypothetical protein
MEYFIIFMAGIIGGMIGSFLVLNLLNRKEKEDIKIPFRAKDAKWKKKASKDLDEMLNKMKEDNK